MVTQAETLHRDRAAQFHEEQIWAKMTDILINTVIRVLLTAAMR